LDPRTPGRCIAVEAEARACIAHRYTSAVPDMFVRYAEHGLLPLECRSRQVVAEKVPSVEGTVLRRVRVRAANEGKSVWNQNAA